MSVSLLAAAALFVSQVSIGTDAASVKTDANGVRITAPGAQVRVDANRVTTKTGTAGVKVASETVEVGTGGASVKVATPNGQTSAVEGRTALKQDRPAPAKLSNISVSGNIKKYTCQPGEGVLIQSNGSVYTLSGPCDTVRVGGTGNSVSVATVRRLEVSGIGHSVKWGKALEASAPIAIVTGTGHAVVQD